MDFITKLGIDWKILLAQVINFGLLMYILAKFVYRPVLDLLQKRQKMVAKTVEDFKKAEATLADIEKIRAESLDQIKVQSVEILEKASKEAEKAREQILSKARQEAENMIAQGKNVIVLEKEKMLQEAKREMSHLILLAVGKILEREFSEADQKRLLEEAAKQISKS